MPGVLYAEMAKAGVWAGFGPNYDTKKICELSSEDACKFAGGQDAYATDPIDRMPVGFRIYDHIM